MKKNFQILISIILFFFTIPIQTKISIPNIPTKVSSFFSRNKEEIIHKEFNNIQRLEISCDHGPITVETWKQPCVLIELKKKGNSQFLEQAAIKSKEHDHHLQISTSVKESAPSGLVSLHVLVPKNLPIKIITTHGSITTKKVSGPLDLQTEKGIIQVIDGTNTVLAKTVQGNIRVQRKSIESDHALNLYSKQGNITLAISQDINADLEAHTQHGSIISELFVTLHPTTILLNENNFKNMHHHVHGWIGQHIQHSNPATILLSTDFGTIKLISYDSVKQKKYKTY